MQTTSHHSPSLVPTGDVTVVRTVADVRRQVAGLRAAGRGVTLVPTMGALHEGHLALVAHGLRDGHAVVVSVFVNPTQFAPGEDLAAYPRQEERDVAMAGGAGASVVFAPGAAEVYPPGFATTVSLQGPALGLEGAARPTHFAGVATVVAKLLLAVRPDRLVLGQKDAQQAAVVRRMMRDLHLDDIELTVHPIVREADGLAMSSRNRYLGAADRVAALALSRGLRAAEALAAGGERDARRLERAAAEVLEATPGVEPEYAALVDPDAFTPMGVLDRPSVLCVAARVGPARLLDNTPLFPT